MLEDLPDVPPAALLVWSEVLVKCAGDYGAARRLLKDLLPELRLRSEMHHHENVNPRRQASVGSFDVYVDGALNVFDPDAGCSSFMCREDTAIRLCRSLGLLADTIWLTDYLTPLFRDFGRLTDEKLDQVLADALVVGQLLPLILHGIVKFRPPWVPVCSSCISHFEQEVDGIALGLVGEFSDQFRLVNEGRVSRLETGELYQPPLDLGIGSRSKRSPSVSDIDEIAFHVVRRAVHSALWVEREAAFGNGSVFSNSRIGMAALAYAERQVSSRAELRLLEERRSVTMPWVSNLSPSQIVQLRSEASKALQLFREMLARCLEVDPVTREPRASMFEVIGELREQAAEVRGELESTSKHAARFWKTSFVTLGFGISAYGLATDQVLPALSALLPLLQLLIQHKAGSEKDADKLQRRPGYVLVKAEDILAHAH